MVENATETVNDLAESTRKMNQFIVNETKERMSCNLNDHYA